MNRLFLLLKNRLTIVSVIVFIIIAVPIVLYVQRPPSNPTISSTPGFTSTPTPIVIKDLSITKVSPSSGAANVSFPPEISVTFSRPLTLVEQSLVTISVASVSGTTDWTDTKTAIFSPKASGISADTFTYKTSVSYGSRKYFWSFTTAPAPTTTINPGEIEQGKLDEQWGKIQQQVQKDYPWMSSLPLSTDEYYVYFDANITTFVVEVYPTSSSTPQDQQVTAIKKDVLQALQRLGIATQNYSFQWDINSTP